jgi:penicillin amidase
MESGMELENREIVLTSPAGSVTIKRNRHGIPEISAGNEVSLAYGLGWVHASDRQLQVLLTRVLLKGQAAEKLAGDSALIEIDRYMRRMNFLPDAEKEVRKLEPPVKEQMLSYADGFNHFLSHNGPVFELKLLGYHPEPWNIRDSLLIGKVFGFIGLADAQGGMEKLLVQMIQKGVDEKKLRELFPYLKEKINYDLMRKVSLAPPMVPEAVAWLAKLPRFSASNNWVVSGALTRSGKPILCNDPHLEVNRLPAIWQEIVMRLPGNTLIGASIPGIPGLALGRTNHLSWGATYSFMDMIDFRIEHCRKGAYRRGREWKPFKVRKEVINVKKGEPVTEKVYENEHGLLEGDPAVEGHYLVMNWSGARDCGAGEFNALLSMPRWKTVREAMECLRRFDAASFNWVIADTSGAIGYQMSGRLFKRPKGVSGLMPLPAWERKYDPAGFVNKTQLPSLYNPKEGFIVTANQDLNHLGKVPAINLPMAAYRAQRITQLLKRKQKFNAEYMKKMHFDLYSLQAQRFMKIIKPLLPDSENGRILRDWDYTYAPDSKGAMLFEVVYLALLRTVFGDHGMGRDVVNHLMLETSMFNDYYGNFDDILLKKKSAWFNGKTQDEIFRRAVEEGLRVRPVPYGATRRITLSHLLFGGKLPGFLGFDYGPIELPGGRATIPQGQIFKSAGRVTTFSPSYRMIADMADGELHTTIAGGAVDRRFSRWYVNEVKNWLRGVYKSLN